MDASRHINPNQLKMFMSANEIMAQYQPLDGDRYDSEEEATHSSGGGDYPTARDWREHRTQHTTGGSRLYIRGGVPETDEELWQRKADEADDYGLRSEIEEEGVQKPVSLGTNIGSQGKPQVVGGHHRIATMADLDPDELMPVIHIKGGLHDARMEGQRAKQGRGGWEYT